METVPNQHLLYSDEAGELDLELFQLAKLLNHAVGQMLLVGE